MTIVIGHASPDIGFLVGDTLVNSLIQIKINPVGPINGEFHALKIQILDPRTAIGFASSNDAEAALRIISVVNMKLRTNPDIEVSDCLFEAYKDEINKVENDAIPDCDFLVLKLLQDTKKLWLVTKDGVHQREQAYVGDGEAYKNLIDLRQPRIPPQTQHVQQPDGSFVIEPLIVSPGEVEFEEVARAMESLVQQRRSKSVGAIAGCILRVVDARQSGALEYLQMGEVGISREEGNTGFSLLASNEGTRGIGIYFRAGRLGFILIVGDTELSRKENAESIQEFISVCREKYGLILTGAA